jgi:hypothetical protein
MLSLHKTTFPLEFRFNPNHRVFATMGECRVPGGPHGLQNRRVVVIRRLVGSIPSLSASVVFEHSGCLASLGYQGVG